MIYAADMKPRVLIAISIVFIATFIAGRAPAEAPCTYLSHDSLAAGVRCFAATRSNYLDTHHAQVMNHMASSDMVDPHPYPASPALDDSLFLSELMIVSGIRHGFSNTYLMYPYSFYMTGYPYVPIYR